MIALKITDIKDFMRQLLIGETFDDFHTVDVSITTFNTFTIDGRLKRDFFDSDACEVLDRNKTDYSFWKEIKSYCYTIIRGKRTPLHFKIVFQLSQEQTLALLKRTDSRFPSEAVNGLFLNLQFKNRELWCTTGVSLNTFLPDKTAELIWDTAVPKFLRDRKIAFETGC